MLQPKSIKSKKVKSPSSIEVRLDSAHIATWPVPLLPHGRHQKQTNQTERERTPGRGLQAPRRHHLLGLVFKQQQKTTKQ